MIDTTSEKDKYFIKYTMNRPLVASMCGVAVVVLAILALVHVFPEPLAALAVIVFGASLLIEGSLVSLEYSQLLTHLPNTRGNRIELGGGMSGEILTGLAGMVLGILAILQIMPQTLLAVAAITFGAGALMGSQVMSRLNALRLEHAEAENYFKTRLEHEIASAAIGIQALVGIAAIILGILALTIHPTYTLPIIALLILGIDSIVSGSAMLERLLGNIRS